MIRYRFGKWRSRIQRRNRKLLKWVVLSYSLLIVLFIAFMVMTCRFVLKNSQEQAVAALEEFADAAMTDVDGLYNGVRGTAYMFGSDIYVRKLGMASSKRDDAFPYHSLQLKERLIMYISVSGIYENVAIYFPNLDFMLTGTGSYDPDKYINGFECGEEIKKLLKERTDLVALPCSLQQLPGVGASSVKFETFPIIIFLKGSGIRDIVMIVSVNPHSLEDALKCGLPGVRSAVLDRNGRILYATEGFDLNVVEGLSDEEVSADLGKFAIVRESKNNGFKLVVAAEESVFRVYSLSTVSRLIIMGVLLTVLCGLLAAGFSNWLYKPVKTMLDRIPACPEGSGEWETILFHMERTQEQIESLSDQYNALMHNVKVMQALNDSLDSKYEGDFPNVYCVFRLHISGLNDMQQAVITSEVDNILNGCAICRIETELGCRLWAYSSTDEEHSEILSKKLRTLVDENEYSEWNFVASICGPMYTLDRMNEARRESFRYIVCGDVNNTSHMYTQNTLVSDQRALNQAIGWKIFQLLSMGDYKGALSVVEDAMNKWIGMHVSVLRYQQQAQSILMILADRIRANHDPAVGRMANTLEMYIHTVAHSYNVSWITENTMQAFQCVLGCQPEEDIRTAQIVKVAFRFMEEHYQEDITIQDAADVLRMNPDYLNSLFSRQIGMTFKKRLDMMRIEQACVLIETTGENISEIARRVGIQNVNTFNRLFKKAEGMSPMSYRRNRCGLPQEKEEE